MDKLHKITEKLANNLPYFIVSKMGLGNSGNEGNSEFPKVKVRKMEKVIICGFRP